MFPEKTERRLEKLVVKNLSFLVTLNKIIF